MELKAGMYVRYRYYNEQKIGKIDFIGKDEFIEEDLLILTNDERVLKTNVLDASYNIIGLIQVGDYVNGYKVLEIYTGNFEPNNPRNVKALKLEFIKEDINPNIPFFKRYNFITNSEIKTIVTKEQFDSMKYEAKQ